MRNVEVNDGLTENGGPVKGGPMKNNRCESNNRKMQDHDNGKVRRWKMEDRKMQDQLSFICTHYTTKPLQQKTHKNVTH